MFKTSSLIFLNALYDYPLFDYSLADTIKVTIVTKGTNYRNFLATVLEAGQINGKTLDVTVLSSNSSEEKENLLQKWPALPSFFNIDDSVLDRNVDSYGSIRFFQFNNSEDIEKYLQKLKTPCRYIYIDCDKQSEQYSEMFYKHNQKFPDTFVLMFNDENNNLYVRDTNQVKQNYSVKETNDEIDRMAFNAHLVWMPRFYNKSLKELHDSFVGSKNYDSSYSLALSFKYKLAAIGIGLDDPAQSAKQFAELLKPNSRTIIELAYMEHRRWTVNQIVLGMNGPQGDGLSKYNYIFDNQNYNRTDFNRHKCDKKSVHSCIVHSRPIIGINESFDWEDGDVELLDDLDRMSVEIHRVYKQNADETWRNKDVLLDRDYLSIKKELESNPRNVDALYEFEQFKMGVFGVLNHDKYRCINFFNNANSLKAFIKKNKDLAGLEHNIDNLVLKLLSTIKAYSYEDFKKKDFNIINNIPFILTFDYRNIIGMPFVVPTKKEKIKDAILDNAGPVAIIKPMAVSYIAFVNNKNRKNVIDMIEACSQYLFSNFKTDISFLLFVDASDQQLVEKLQLLKKAGTIKNYEIVVSEGADKDSDSALEYLLQTNANYYCFTDNTFPDQITNAKFVEKTSEFIESFCFDITEVNYLCNFRCLDNSQQTDRLKYISNINCLGKEFIGFGDLLSLIDNSSSYGATYFVCEKEINYLWKTIFKQGGNKLEQLTHYMDFCEFVVNHLKGLTKQQKGVCSSLVFDERSYVKHSYLINILINGDIAKCRIENGKTILEFASNDIIKLFCKQGDLFERYCYYSCVASGYFDEVISGVLFKYQKNQSSNELDLVLVKGLKTIILECKSISKNPDEDMVRKLQYICNYFGANAVGVLGCALKVNANYKGVLALSDYTNIRIIDDVNGEFNIADKLKEIMEEQID